MHRGPIQHKGVERGLDPVGVKSGDSPGPCPNGNKTYQGSESNDPKTVKGWKTTAAHRPVPGTRRRRRQPATGQRREALDDRRVGMVGCL